MLSGGNDGGGSLLHEAAARGDTNEVWRLIRETGADVATTEGSRRTPLHLAAANGHAGTVCCLVSELGADMRAEDRFGCTPLHVAVLRGHTDVARAFVKGLGADVGRLRKHATPFGRLQWTCQHRPFFS